MAFAEYQSMPYYVINTTTQELTKQSTVSRGWQKAIHYIYDPNQ